MRYGRRKIFRKKYRKIYSEQIHIVSIIGMAAGEKFTLPSQNKHYNIRDMVTLFMGENRQEPMSV